MKRIEIDCQGIENAVEKLEQAGFTILRNPAHPFIIHVAADKIDLKAVREFSKAHGRVHYTRLTSGKRRRQYVTTSARLSMLAQASLHPTQWPVWARVAVPVSLAATAALATYGLHLAGVL